MLVTYPKLLDSMRAHPSGEDHLWRGVGGPIWVCAMCGHIINRKTGEVMREGRQNEG